MAITKSTSGTIGRQVAGAESVEIKATIAHKGVGNALQHFSIREKDGEHRFIYFFDTAGLDLFRSGVIVRARRIPGSTHDSTVKIRPVHADDIPTKWLNDKGFKLEADVGEKGIVRSASLTRPLAKGLIKEVEAGKRKLSDLFDAKQQLFLAEMCRARYDLDKLLILGPTGAQIWKVVHEGLPWPLTAELWRRDDGASVLEASARAPVAQAAVANAGFFAFLAELGAERDNAQQAKTRWALDHHAARLAKSAKVKPKAPAEKKRRPNPAVPVSKKRT